MDLVLAILVMGLPGYSWYKRYPIEKFCESIPPSATAESVLSEAESKGFITRNYIARRGEAMILNHQNPAWRFACIVKFQEGKVAGKSVIIAD